jgi:hypothetical protein
MTKTADIIQKSELNQLLSLISTVTGITGTTVTMIEQAALQLGKLIGNLLQMNANDYVDYYEGYFPASKPWILGNEEYKHSSTTLVLNKY